MSDAPQLLSALDVLRRTISVGTLLERVYARTVTTESRPPRKDGSPSSAAIKAQAQQIALQLSVGCESVAELAAWLMGDESCRVDGGVDPNDLTLGDVQLMFAADRTIASASASIAAHPNPTPPPKAAAEQTQTALPPELRPTLSFNALDRARTTLQDFTNFYFPLNGLPKEAFFEWLPVLVFVEAAIYELDEENELLAERGVETDGGTSTGVADTLRGVLHVQKLWSPLVEAELQAGEEYWALERKLCAAMSKEQPISLHEVLRASELKSFDYRLLHTLLYGLCGKATDTEEARLINRFMRIDERLTDIADDLYDYEDDVRRNSFNVLRGFVHALGRDAALDLATHISRLEREHQQLLEALPVRARNAYIASRENAMRRPGSERWVFPVPITPTEEVALQAAQRREDGELRKVAPWNGDEEHIGNHATPG